MVKGAHSASLALVLLLIFASQLELARTEESDGTNARYVLVLAEGTATGSTLSGNCRGNGGSADRVNSKSKLLSKQALCRDECDLLGKDCTGYSYTAASEKCVIHGPGMSGTCALQGRISVDECGICGGKHSGLAAKQTRTTCGDCSLKPTTDTIWDETENFCRAEGGQWTAGTWAPSKWSEPADGWTGHSHATTYVHSADGVEGTDCYDKNPWDGRPQCLSASEQDRDVAEHLCQNDFDDEIWKQRNAGADDVCPRGCTLQKPYESQGPVFEQFVTCLQERSSAEEGYVDRECTKDFERNLDQKAALCNPNSCQFKQAPVMRQIHEDAHAPAHRLPGWRYDIVSRGDTVGQTYPEGTFGDCRIEGNGMKTVMSKSCGRTCTASNGMSVVLQEGCAQACLDDASGSCVGYAHSADSCILYSPFAHRYLVHDNGDTWARAGGQVIPCISHNSPTGCKTINAAKPNPAYICALLEQTPSRWEAWGRPGGRKYVAVRIITSGASKDKFTTDVTKSLRRRMAGLAFVNTSSSDDSQVALSVSTKDLLSSYPGSEVVLDFVVAANSSTDRAMRRLLDAQTSTAGKRNMLEGSFTACVCVCARARARARICRCVHVLAHQYSHGECSLQGDATTQRARRGDPSGWCRTVAEFRTHNWSHCGDYMRYCSSKCGQVCCRSFRNSLWHPGSPASLNLAAGVNFASRHHIF